jgi:hypothetical protein
MGMAAQHNQTMRIINRIDSDIRMYEAMLTIARKHDHGVEVERISAMIDELHAEADDLRCEVIAG